VTPEDFARFLESLSTDPEEAGRRYTGLLKKLIGFFGTKGLSDPESAADETIDRAVTKINAGAVVPDMERYCIGIARNLAKEKLRRLRREHTAFHKFIEAINNYSPEPVDRIYNLLKPCFEHLSVEEQQLLAEYCYKSQGQARAEQRRQLAETMQVTVLALRIKVTRLRNKLTDCVKKLSK